MQTVIQAKYRDAAQRKDKQLRRNVYTEQFLAENTRNDHRKDRGKDF
jgi:hypothetical protein